jgi:hypothetical protein
MTLIILVSVFWMHAAGFFFQSASNIIQGLTIIINVAKQTITSVCIIINRMASGLQPDAGRGQSYHNYHIVHGFSLVKGKARHAMEDYLVAEFKKSIP